MTTREQAALLAQAEADLAVCEAAPAGPWRDDGLDYFHEDEPVRCVVDETGGLIAYVDCGGRNQSEAAADPEARAKVALIVLARQALPAWIERWREAQARIAFLEAENARLLADWRADRECWEGKAARLEDRVRDLEKLVLENEVDA